MTETEWIAGENCDVILYHYAHDPIPLVCYRIQSDPIGPRVRIHFETYWPDGENIGRETKPTTVRHLWFTILLSDETLCPDGGWYPYEPAAVRSAVNAILHELTDISLYTQSGIISGLYCDEHAIIDTIYQNAHTIEVNLTTRSLNDTPIGPESKDTWLPASVIRPYSTWGTAVWNKDPGTGERNEFSIIKFCRSRGSDGSQPV